MNAFHGLSRREKMLVLVALPLVVLFAGYRFVWMPLNEARMAARAEIRGYQTLIEAAENQGNQPAEVESVAVVTTPLATRITESAELAGVLVRRLDVSRWMMHPMMQLSIGSPRWKPTRLSPLSRLSWTAEPHPASWPHA